jgi:hypothetical protein
LCMVINPARKDYEGSSNRELWFTIRKKQNLSVLIPRSSTTFFRNDGNNTLKIFWAVTAANTKLYRFKKLMETVKQPRHPVDELLRMNYPIWYFSWWK